MKNNGKKGTKLAIIPGRYLRISNRALSYNFRKIYRQLRAAPLATLSLQLVRSQCSHLKEKAFSTLQHVDAFE